MEDNLKKAIKIQIYIIFLSLLFLGCTESKKSNCSKLKGKWAIENIKFNNEEYKDYLLSNVIIFKENNEISIPETVHFIKDYKSYWICKFKDDDKNHIRINSSNLAFKGNFSIRFFDNEQEKLKGVILESDSIYIRAYKLLQNFDR